MDRAWQLVGADAVSFLPADYQGCLVESWSAQAACQAAMQADVQYWLRRMRRVQASRQLRCYRHAVAQFLLDY